MADRIDLASPYETPDPIRKTSIDITDPEPPFEIKISLPTTYFGMATEAHVAQADRNGITEIDITAPGDQVLNERNETRVWELTMVLGWTTICTFQCRPELLNSWIREWIGLTEGQMMLRDGSPNPSKHADGVPVQSQPGEDHLGKIGIHRKYRHPVCLRETSEVIETGAVTLECGWFTSFGDNLVAVTTSLGECF
jgi:hypothetical protein